MKLWFFLGRLQFEFKGKLDLQCFNVKFKIIIHELRFYITKKRLTMNLEKILHEHRI